MSTAFSSMTPTLEAMERLLSRGQSLTPAERSLVLKHGIPLWLVLGAKSGTPSADRCQKAIDHLSDLYDTVQAELPPLLRDKRHE